MSCFFAESPEAQKWARLAGNIAILLVVAVLCLILLPTVYAERVFLDVLIVVNICLATWNATRAIWNNHKK